MAAASSAFFQCPAYKLMIGDITSAVKIKAEQADEMVNWRFTITHIPSSNGHLQSIHSLTKSKLVELDLQLVWIQGKILRMEEVVSSGNPSMVISDDEVHEATILEYNTYPGGDHPEIKEGSHIGVIGQIWSQKPTVVIKPTKLMLLGSNSTLEAWKDEVRFGKAFLAGLIEPSIT